MHTQPITITAYGFPGALSEMVAREVMLWEAFDAAQDDDFLVRMSDGVQILFWAKYVRNLDAAERQELVRLMGTEDFDAYVAWHKQHCDIVGDPIAKKKADKALLELAAELPAFLKKEYTTYRNTQISIE